ncbi:UDP-N-acetylglucosamine 2-epimerase (non-hydrolyzing) [Kocuria gwangalliensis]|uniref:UDP-N-acetylglucosamine 2-epimerase (non-hydrolyzing) n=1 Tax=Kocuria gwangalliensis TaxID=501592 RepID=A0ABP8WDU0_9MICC
MVRTPPLQPVTIMAVYGTLPEGIKMAPLVLALRKDPRFRVRVVVTGQHREMLEQVNEDFGIVPDHDLDIHVPGQTLTQISARTLEGLTRVLQTERPDAVLVQGDTTTSFMGALAASYSEIPVIHTEAGLRTGDRSSPFPEEINRRLTGQIASLHLAPTAASRENLLRENVAASDIVVTGNSGIDALLATVASRPRITDVALVRRLGRGRPVVLVTAHRRQSWGEPLEAVGRAVATLARRHPDHDFIFPAHPNPMVREALRPALRGHDNVLMIEPLPYAQFCALMERSKIILTDSGGVQEEGPSLGKPVLVLRETTERPEAVETGMVKLVGTDENTIAREVSTLISNSLAYGRMSRGLDPYGDGRAAERTVHAAARHFGMGDAVDEFSFGKPPFTRAAAH